MYRASQLTRSPISRAARRTAAANSPGERCPRNCRKARFGLGGRGDWDEVIVDDAMAGSSLALGRTVRRCMNVPVRQMPSCEVWLQTGYLIRDLP
jgi:hypothetical protein